MEPNDGLTIDEVSYCLAKEGEVYAVYAEANADKIKLDLRQFNKTFKIKWFDPRNGGELQTGSILTVTGGSIVELGVPPSSIDKDWVVLIN